LLIFGMVASVDDSRQTLVSGLSRNPRNLGTLKSGAQPRPREMFLDKIHDSPAFEIFNLASRKQAAGEKVVSLAIGEPSFDTPLPIVKAAYESMKSGGGHYTSSWGSKTLREAIVEKVRRKNRINAALELSLIHI